MSASQKPTYLQMAIPSPLLRCFDYLPLSHSELPLIPGQRFLVPFGPRKVIAILLKVIHKTNVPANKLKAVISQIDETPLITEELLKLYQWISDYYHHPIGDTILSTLAKQLRDGKTEQDYHAEYLLTAKEITSENLLDLNRSKKQAALYQKIKNYPQGIDQREIIASGFSKIIIKSLADKNYIQKQAYTPQQDLLAPDNTVNPSSLTLNQAQIDAINAVNSCDGFKSFLLEGVTGSGKTEVYLQIIEHILKQNKQALVLVPEISLTPQTISRFETRFNVPVTVMHSHLTDKTRAKAWLAVRNNQTSIVIGTRSAIFAPFSNLGVIIMDEEHDQSYKQQAGLRYSARDIAVRRAHMNNIPVVLGTATPSIETFYNAELGRYQRLVLPKRATKVAPPKMHLIDLRRQHLTAGLSKDLIRAIEKHLAAKGQVLLFLNRRGFAPTLYCHDCSWIACCPRCDAHLTMHQYPSQLACHHCGFSKNLVKRCGKCNSKQLIHLGLGTEQLEEALNALFPDKNVLRIDRDSTSRKGSFEKKLEQIHDQSAHILIGTQMLAKGHHFPNLSCVAIVNVDSGLYSTDFRATEHLGQLIVQVAGRAGRETPGEVYLQTHQPNHPLLQTLLTKGFRDFSKNLIEERRSTNLPPFSYLALFSAEANNRQTPRQFLYEIKNLFDSASQQISILGPIPANMERKDGKFRMQLLCQSSERAVLHQYLSHIRHQIDDLPSARRVKWVLDVDPLEIC